MDSMNGSWVTKPMLAANILFSIFWDNELYGGLMIDKSLITPEQILNEGFEHNASVLVTQKHSYSGSSSFSGCSGTVFTPEAEQLLRNWSANRSAFNVYAYTGGRTADIYVQLVDGRPIGINGEPYAKFYSGCNQGVHGCPLSATSATSLPVGAFNMMHDETCGWHR